MDHGLPSTLGYVGVMNYVLIEVKAMPKALVGSPAEHSWCNLSNLNLSTARCRQFIARLQGEHSQFIHVILWKILLTSSETNGYKITGHDNNFIAGILLMKTLGTLKTRLLATLFDTKPVLWTLSLMIFYTATIAAFVQHLTTFYKPSCGSLVGLETVTLVCAVVPFMILDTVQHAPENPSFLVYSRRFSDGEKAL